MKSSVKGVHVITDTFIQNRFNHVELARFAAEAGVSVVQFRDKHQIPAAMLPTLRRMTDVCKKQECSLLVNDRVDLAMAAGATGVHLGQNDLPIKNTRTLLGDEAVIGGTASNLGQALQVQEDGADYVGFGHIFRTGTKQKDYEPRGIEGLRTVTSELQIPVIAIGGIREEHVGEIIGAGAEGFAVSSAVCADREPLEAARRLVDRYQKYQ